MIDQLNLEPLELVLKFANFLVNAYKVGFSAVSAVRFPLIEGQLDIVFYLVSMALGCTPDAIGMILGGNMLENPRDTSESRDILTFIASKLHLMSCLKTCNSPSILWIPRGAKRVADVSTRPANTEVAEVRTRRMRVNRMMK